MHRTGLRPGYDPPAVWLPCITSKRSAALGSATEIKERRPARTNQDGDPMSNVPQHPDSGNPAPGSGPSSSLIDLIAFLAVLALGGLLLAFGHTTAGSLAASCAALGGLYAAWKRLHVPGRPPPGDEPDREPDDRSGLLTRVSPPRPSVRGGPWPGTGS